MAILTESAPVSDTPKTGYVTVKIRSSIHRQARQVATFNEVNIADYLSDLLEKLVEADHRKMRKAMDADDKRKENGK